MSLPLHPPSSPRTTPALRTFALWLCVLAMLGGTVDLHSLAGGHGAADLLPPPAAQAGDDTVFACAEGHTPATHVEAPLEAKVHRCEACLHRQQHRGGELLVAGLHGADLSAGPVAAPDSSVATTTFLEHAPSRGPPAA